MSPSRVPNSVAPVRSRRPVDASSTRGATAGIALAPEDYALLADFRRHLRSFLLFSEEAARRVGLTPRQHQALLALRGSEQEEELSVGDLAQRLLIRHHSAVGLVNRLAAGDLVQRRRSPQDRRVMLLRPTARARRLLALLSREHKAEIRRIAPVLRALLNRLERDGRGKPPG